MRRRGTGRFALAFAAVVLVAQARFSTVMEVGSRAGGAGVIAALFAAGFLLALLFTAIFDGPRSLAGLLKRRPRSA